MHRSQEEDFWVAKVKQIESLCRSGRRREFAGEA
jgi:hypothetical protein